MTKSNDNSIKVKTEINPFISENNLGFISKDTNPNKDTKDSKK